MRLTIDNPFHASSVTLIVRDDGTISERQWRSALRRLCGVQGCRCFTSAASGPDVLRLLNATPPWAGALSVRYRLAGAE